METKKITLLVKLTFIAFMFLLTCCGDSTNNNSISNNQIKTEIIELNDTCFEIKKYSLKGSLLSIGRVCDSLKEGYWEEYYTDGTVKWKGKYLKGKRQYAKMNFDTVECNLTIKGNPEFLKLNQEYPFRVEVPGVHPDDVGLTIDKAKFWIYKNTDDYDYAFMPIQKDTLAMELLIGNPKEKTSLCKILFIVK